MKVFIMATGSAFGFSAYDPIGSYFEGSLNSYFDKSSENRAFLRQLHLMEKQYEYAQRYAENTPSWQVKGLRDAGLNPILAVSNGVNMGGSAPSVPSSTSYRSPITSKASFSGSGLLPFDRRITKQTADAQTLSAQAADKQADAALIKANSDRSESISRIAKLVEEVRGLEQNRKSQEKGGNYRHSIISDIMKVSSDFLDTLIDMNAPFEDWLTDPVHSYGESYLKTGPNATKQSDIRGKESDRVLDSQWKTRLRSIDDKPVYRKRGDVGGIMHMYR